jgi:chemotaxis response regulator CheB
MEKEGVILIGGSAGSIEVVLNLLPYIPENFPYPLVIVLHRKSTAEYFLEEVLGRKCKLKVLEAEDKMQLKGQTIFLVPGDYHLLTDASGCLSLDTSEKVHFSRPSIDVCFDSFAKAFGDKCLGILLSGANSDGAMGLKRIKDAGGITIVQSPESAKSPVMPLAAISLFQPDMIGDVMKIMGVFSELNQHSFSEFRSKLRMGEELENDLPSVLIVDDISENLIALNAILKSEDLIIHKAESGKIALEMAMRNPYDCIILDVQMPEMDGFEVAKILGEKEETKNIPIIFLSALGSDRSKVIQGINNGAIDFLSKPPDPDLLKAKIKLCLNISKKTKQNRRVHSNVLRERDTIKEHSAGMEASLRYARNIQQALLPKEEFFNSFFSENFVHYQPKESIGGDFYTVKEKDGNVVLICGDCTGHGVPGAMLTMISLNIINNLIEGKGITRPDKILNAMAQEFRTAFNSEFSPIQIDDGLEMAVCTFKRSENKMQFASARRPLLLVQGNELKKIDSDFMGISVNMPENYSYNMSEINLQRDDCIYLFSDGIADQFGGKQGKKFMMKRLTELILSVHKKPMREQINNIDHAIQTWKGDHSQTDDILILGVRYPSGQSSTK